MKPQSQRRRESATILGCKFLPRVGQAVNCADQVTYDALYLKASFIFACFLLQLGLEILAFPCNQFAGQEPDSDEQIVEFACTRFKAEYPIFRKVYPIKTLFFMCVRLLASIHRCICFYLIMSKLLSG
jgi:glutathione peroxidase-family protein